MERILDDFRGNIGSNLKREDLITRADLHNVKQKYNITIQDGQLNKNDATSVDIWVEQMKQEKENNPVIYYKKKGEVDGNNILDLKDFCIILMDPSQMHMLKQFGNGKIVCIDGTHGLNAYDFELVTLLVVDDFDSGFPCCFMFTNLKDTKIYTVMFSTIKNKVGIISPDTFMTDIVETFYSAWENIMGSVPHRLLCSWHVDRAWRQNICKITGPTRKEKQETIYKSLKVLQSMCDENEFNNALKEFNHELMNDPDTRDFGIYFDRIYGNRVGLWAYCHRKGLGVNCNMHLESMHKTIKYHYLNGCKVGQLDKSITTIRRYTRDKKVERIIKLTKGKTSTRIQEIKKRHNKSTLLDLTINQDSANNWSVESEYTPSQFYKIKKNNDDVCCPMMCSNCKLCIHTFQCSCPDYQIKSMICKHIHYVALKTMSTENSVDNTILSTADIENINFDATSNKDNEIQVHIKTLENKKTINMQEQFKEKAISLANKINNIKNSEHLKQALKQLNSIEAFIDAASNNDKTLEDFSKTINEPPNKKLKTQDTFFSTKKKKKQEKLNELSKPTRVETEHFNNILLQKKNYILSCDETEHSYFKK
ncbi:Transporter [Aphis craccivora]|uniref:Transporter n=1 Tax=Aphis craccivora TaxID=307492 RepID=A0A6G0VSV6_APHCR|nr:Transporter [Aphis craccivora]